MSQHDVETAKGATHHVELPAHLANDAKLQSMASEYVPGTAEERALVRKVDAHILPILWVMYVFNYLDRTNIGNAKVGGMQADLKMTSADYSLVLSIFFVAYLLFEIPSNMILARSKPSLFLPTLMVVWGAVSIGVKGVTNFGGMIAFRIALGLIEAGFFPGVMLLMSCWYKPRELSKRVALFYTASLVSGAFGGLLAGGIIDGLEGAGGVRGWKWLFMIEGLATVCVGSVAYFLLPNFPTTTRWLSEDEKRLATVRLAIREDLEVHETHKQALFAALRDPKTWLFMIAYNLLTATGTISYFFPTLMGALGYKGNKVQFMTVPIYLVSLFIALMTGWSADRTGQKAYHLIAACAWGSICFIICAAAKNFAVRYAFICLGGAGVWSAIPLFLSWMVTMFEGRERRAVSIAVINGLGNLASVYGSYIWPSDDAPQYVMGFAITTAFMAIGGIVSFGLKWKYGDREVALKGGVGEDERRV